MKIGWLLLCLMAALLVTISQARFVVRSLQREELRTEAQGEVRRLADVTLKLYQGGRPPLGEAFWKEIGRTDPLYDPWGKPYELENPRPGLYLWRSAGPDGGYDTADDFIARVPYGSGIDLDSPELAPKSLPVISAQ